MGSRCCSYPQYDVISQEFDVNLADSKLLCVDHVVCRVCGGISRINQLMEIGDVVEREIVFVEEDEDDGS